MITSSNTNDWLTARLQGMRTSIGNERKCFAHCVVITTLSRAIVKKNGVLLQICDVIHRLSLTNKRHLGPTYGKKC